MMWGLCSIADERRETRLFGDNASKRMSDEQNWSRQGPRAGEVVDKCLAVSENAVFVDSPGKLVLCNGCLVSKNQDPGLRAQRWKKIGRPENGLVLRVVIREVLFCRLGRAWSGKEPPEFGGLPAIAWNFVTWGRDRPGIERVALKPMDENDASRISRGDAIDNQLHLLQNRLQALGLIYRGQSSCRHIAC